MSDPASCSVRLVEERVGISDTKSGITLGKNRSAIVSCFAASEIFLFNGEHKRKKLFELKTFTVHEAELS